MTIKKTKFATLIFGLAMACVTHAETVPVVWGFSVASNTANVLRAGINAANQNQNHDIYVFNHRPGAGGSIAANSVINSGRTEILAATTSFVIRPLALRSQETHRVDKFKPIMMFAADQVPVFMSKKFRTWSDIQQQQSVTVGVIPGSLVHLAAIELQKTLANTQLVFVFFPDTIEAVRNVMGGHLDLTGDFLADNERWIDSGMLNAVAMTGSRSIKGIPTFASLGIKGLEAYVTNYWLLVPVDTEQTKVEKFRKDFAVLINDVAIKQRQQNAYLSVPELTLTEVQNRFAQEQQHWRRALRDINF